MGGRSIWWMGARTPFLHYVAPSRGPVISDDQVFYPAVCGALVLPTDPVSDELPGLRRCVECVELAC
jgi:hypothetical protein